MTTTDIPPPQEPETIYEPCPICNDTGKMPLFGLSLDLPCPQCMHSHGERMEFKRLEGEARLFFEGIAPGIKPSRDEVILAMKAIRHGKDLILRGNSEKAQKTQTQQELIKRRFDLMEFGDAPKQTEMALRDPIKIEF